jgi:hypothetical protein
MPILFNVDKELNFQIEILIDPLLQEMDTRTLFRSIITIAKKIQLQYSTFIKEEGRILGLERTLLIENLDYLFVQLSVLRKKLKDHLISNNNILEEYQDKVFITYQFNKFSVIGKFRKEDLFSIENFKKDYEVLIRKKIKDLLVRYKYLRINRKNRKRLLNKVKEVYHTFDDILYNIVEMRYNLQNCLIDT